MTDPRVVLHAALGEWLRVRADVRAMATKLEPARFALRRDAGAGGDVAYDDLQAQLAKQRADLDALGCELDAKIAALRMQCDAMETEYVAALVDAADLKRNSRRL